MYSLSCDLTSAHDRQGYELVHRERNKIGSATECRSMLVEPEPKRFRAAQYVRMSTDHQQYSTQNQADKIAEYARQRNMEIVRTYADEGKSGLSIGGRASLQKLISDVETGAADFSIVLVYDVSRWGRFQDADEAAFHEYVLKRKGIQVTYVAEQFETGPTG